MTEDDPQKTQEWSPPAEDVPGATAGEATAAAAAREASAQAERQGAEARAAEIRAEVSESAARRAEEATGKAHDEVEAAEQAEEKLSRKERKAKEAAERAEAEATRAREQAARARSQVTSPQPPESSLSGAHVTGPGIGSETDPATAASAAAYRPPVAADTSTGAASNPLERPEVVAGIAFAGAFIVARVLKRIFD